MEFSFSKNFCFIIFSCLTNLTFIKFGILCGPFGSQPTITTKEGNLVFETASDKTIAFRSSNGGKINVNNDNLGNLVDDAKSNSSRWQSLTSTHITAIQDKINNLDEQLAKLSDGLNGTQIIEGSVKSLKQKIDGILGTGRTAMSPFRVRLALRRISKLLNDFNSLKATIALDECASNPCNNSGRCIDGYKQFFCHCTDGWRGDTCELDVDECAAFSGTDIGCQNGATCINTPGSYRCQCKADWKGVHCTEKHDDCTGASNKELCDHGTCVNIARKNAGQPKYRCECDQGWKSDGVNPACSLDVDECSLPMHPCSVDPFVQCYNLPGTFSCGSCPSGYIGTGFYCRDIDECQTNNGGCSLSPRVSCLNTRGSRVCGLCPPGYSGDGVSCTFVGLCKTNNGGCSPHAKCTEGAGDVRCECPPSYTGNGIGSNGCVPKAGSNCSSNPCIHGTCFSSTQKKNGFTCQCFPGFSGDVCDVANDECNSNPCKNGGVCVNQENGFICICEVDWKGKTCEQAREKCGGTFAQPAGYIKYPLSDSSSSDSKCVWKIITTFSKVINVVFSKFNVDSFSSGVEIRDGLNKDAPLIGNKRYYNDISNLPNGGNITTNSHYLYIEFAERKGNSEFELTWNTTEAICGGEIEAEFGNIRFPVNGGYYAPNRDCFWLVKVPLSKRIQFHFPLIAIEVSPDCVHDYLHIYDGQNLNDTILAKYCNSTNSPPLTTLSSYALIHFHSDMTVSDLGFHLTFASVPGVEGCGGLYSQARGVIRSPNFPLRYDNGLECDYLIKLRSLDDTIYLNFTTFELEFHDRCKFDFIEIFDGANEDAPRLGRYCKPSNKPPTIISSTNALFIKFRTDGSMGGNGFLGQYETNCGGYFNSSYGILKSPNFPNPYPSEKQCFYTIDAMPGTFIKLQFLEFGLEYSLNCTLDYVEVRQKVNDDETLLAKFCGEETPRQTIVSNAQHLTVLFKSDGSVQNKGFLANYTSIVKV